MSFYYDDTDYFDVYANPPAEFYGPDTSVFDQALADNGGFYGPDTSWINQYLVDHFDPTNPYMVDAAVTTTAQAESVYESTNSDWEQYLQS